MHVSRFTEIDASPQEVWKLVSNIENADAYISGIKKVEIIEKAAGPSLTGLKWRETREWQGKDAEEVMWITDAEEASFYEAHAQSHGSLYISRIELDKTATGTRLTKKFTGQPLTFGAKILWALTGWMVRKALFKTLDQDLADIKNAVMK